LYAACNDDEWLTWETEAPTLLLATATGTCDSSARVVWPDGHADTQPPLVLCDGQL
jgi:hypothetical protein